MSAHSNTGTAHPGNKRSQTPSPQLVSLKQHLSPGVTNAKITEHISLISTDVTLARLTEQSAFANIGDSEIMGGFYGIDAEEEAKEFVRLQAEMQMAKLEAEHARNMAQLESKMGAPHPGLYHTI